VFLLPLALSFWMYYGNNWVPASRTNHGELINPRARYRTQSCVKPTATWRRQTVEREMGAAYIGDGACDDTCKSSLYFMRQTRLSLNNENDAGRRVFLATGTCCNHEFLEREHPGLVVIDATGTEAQEMLGAFPRTGSGALAVHHRSARQSRHALRHAGRSEGAAHGPEEAPAAVAYRLRLTRLMTSFGRKLHPSTWIRRLALAGLLLCFVVVVLGAYVRLTAAGLGCPDWPGATAI
jgi:hypothetical protein